MSEQKESYWGNVQARWRVVRPRVIEFLGRSAAERTGLQAGGIVLVVCLGLTVIGWVPLSWPARIVNTLVGGFALSSCDGFAAILVGVCNAALAFVTLTGSLVVLAILFVFRLPLASLLQRQLANLPSEAAFLAAPVITTVLFTLGWSGVAFHFFARPGLVPDGIFPAFVGLMTFAIARYGSAIQDALAPYFEARERLQFRVRLGLASLLTIFLAIILTPMLTAPVRDQIVVILAIASAFLLLAPTRGDVSTALSEALSKKIGGRL